MDDLRRISRLIFGSRMDIDVCQQLRASCVLDFKLLFRVISRQDNP
jgi:hypothetical protein